MTKFGQTDYACPVMGWAKALKKTNNVLNAAFRGRIIVKEPTASPEKLILHQSFAIIQEL